MLQRIKNRVKKHLLALQRTLRQDGGLITRKDDTNIVIDGHPFGYDRTGLQDIIDRVPRGGKMVEIGSLIGFSTRLFSYHFDEVISIDPYKPGYDSSDYNSLDYRLSLARDLFTIRFMDDPKVVQYRESSEKGHLRFEDVELDFVYIDGDHTFEGVKQDIQHWKPKVRPGGYLAGDDHDWEGVEKAVAHHFSSDHVQTVRDRWVVQIT